MEALRKCRWWTRKKMAGLTEDKAAEAPEKKKEERPGKTKRLTSLLQDGRYVGMRKHERWRWKSLWKQQTVTEPSLFDFPNAVSLPAILSSKAANNEERGGEAAGMSSIGLPVRGARLVRSHSLDSSSHTEKDKREKLQDEQREERTSARELATRSKLGSVCGVEYERRSKEENTSAQSTQWLPGKDSSCSEHLRVAGSTSLKFGQVLENGANHGPSKTKSRICTYSGQEGNEIISPLGRLQPAEVHSTFSRFREHFSSERSAPTIMTIASNRNASSTVATSCPPSPADTDRVSLSLSSPATASTARRRGATDAADIPAVDTAAAVADDIPADTSPRTPVATEQFVSPGVRDVTRSVAGAASITRESQSVEEGDFDKRLSSNRKSRTRPFLHTNPYALMSLKTTAAVERSAAGIRPTARPTPATRTRPAAGSRPAAESKPPAETRPTAAGTEGLSAPFRSPHVAQLSTSRRAALPFVEPLRPSTSTVAIGAAPLLESSRSVAGSWGTDGFAPQQDANDAGKWYQEQQQQQLCQQLGQQQKSLEQHRARPLKATQPVRGRIQQVTVRPCGTPSNRAAASVSHEHGCVALCPTTIEEAEAMRPPPVLPSERRVKNAANVAAVSHASCTAQASSQSPAATAEEASRMGAARIPVPQRLSTHLKSSHVAASPATTRADAVTDAAETASGSGTASHCLLHAHHNREARPDVSDPSPLSGCSVAASTSSPSSSASLAAASPRNSVSRSVISCPSSRSSGRRLSCDTTLSSNDATTAKVGLSKSEAAAEIKPALLTVFKPFTSPQLLTPNEVGPPESTAILGTSRSTAAAAPTTPASHSAICGVAAPVCSPRRRLSSSSTLQASFDGVDLTSQQDQQQQRRNTPTSRPQTALSRKQVAVPHSEGESKNNTYLGEASIVAEKAFSTRDTIFNAELEEQGLGTTPHDLTAKQSETEKTATSSSLESSGPKTTCSIVAAADGSATKESAIQNTPVATRLKGMYNASSIVKMAGAKTGEERRQNARRLEKQQSGHRRQKPPVPIDPGYIGAVEKRRQLHRRQQLGRGDGSVCNMVNSANSRDGSALARAEFISTHEHKEHDRGATSSSGKDECLRRESSAADVPSPPVCGSLSASNDKAAEVSLTSPSTGTAANEEGTEIQPQQQLYQRPFQQRQVAEEEQQPEQGQPMEQGQKPQQVFNEQRACLPRCTTREASLLLKCDQPGPSLLPPQEQIPKPCERQPHQQWSEEAQARRRPACDGGQDDPLETGAVALGDTTTNKPSKVKVSSDAYLSGKVDPLLQPEATVVEAEGWQTVSSQRSAASLAAADVPSGCMRGTFSSSAAVVETCRVIPSSSAGGAMTPAPQGEGEEVLQAENLPTAAAGGGEGGVTPFFLQQKGHTQEEEEKKDTAGEKKPLPLAPGTIISREEATVTEKREADVSSAVTSETPTGQLPVDSAIGRVKASAAAASSASSVVHTKPSVAKPAETTVVVAAAGTTTPVQGLTALSLPPPAGHHAEGELPTTKEVEASVVLNKTASAESRKEEELTLTETVLATVGQGVTTVLEYGATTLRDFITESLPALSSDEGTSPCSSPSHHAYGKRGSSGNIWRNSSGIWRSTNASRKHTAREGAEEGSRHTSVRRACSAGAAPVPDASFQSIWARSNGSVLLPPPLLVRECMLPSAAASGRGRPSPPLSSTAKTCRRSNSFSEAQHSSQLRQAWSLAALGQTHSKRLPPSFFPPRTAACASTSARREEVGDAADGSSQQERYFRTPSPALSEPSSLWRRQQQQPETLLQYRHHHTSALTPVMLAAGRQVSDQRRLSVVDNTLGYDRGSSAFSVQNLPEHRWRSSLSPSPAGLRTASSSLSQPAGRPPPLPTQRGRLLLPQQPSPRVRVPSPTSSCKNTIAAVVPDIFTPHAGFVGVAPPVGAAGVHVSEAGAEKMIGLEVKRVTTPLFEHQQQRSGRSYISVPPVLPKSEQKEERLPVQYLHHVQQLQQQQQQLRQGLCSPSGQVSPYRVLPAAGFVSQTRGNLPPEAGGRAHLVDVSRVQSLQPQRSQELLQHYQQQHHPRFQPGIDTHFAAIRGMDADLLSHTFGSDEISVMSPAWQKLPSSSPLGAAGLRHSADIRDRLAVSGGDECEKASRVPRYTSPRLFDDSGSGGGERPQQQKEVELPQQHHMLRASAHLGSSQQVVLQVADFHPGKEHSSSPPATVREAHAATGAEAVQSPRYNHTHTDAGEAAACSPAAVHLAVTAGAPTLGRTADCPAVAGVPLTGDPNAKWLAPSSCQRGQPWLCEQQQRHFHYSESREHQLQFQNGLPALHRDNPALVQGKHIGVLANVKCPSGSTVRPVVFAGLGREYSRRTGVDDEDPDKSLAAVPNILEVPNANISAIQHALLHQRTRQRDPGHLPELAEELSERGGIGVFVQAGARTAADKRALCQEVSLTTPPSTHRGEREVRVTAARQDGVLTRQEPNTNWTVSCSLASQQNTKDSYHPTNLSQPNLTTERRGIVNTPRLACANPINDGNDRSDAPTPAASAAGAATINRKFKTDGTATTAEASRGGEVPGIGIEGEHAPLPFWRQERMSNVQVTSQQQELHGSQHCQVLSDVGEQQHLGGLVRHPRPPSPFRARWLREELVRKRATGQLRRENFPLEEVENLLQSFHVKKVNGVLIYDVEGQEATRGVLPRSEAAGAAAVTFSLPNSRTASGFTCNTGLTAGVMRTNKKEDEEVENMPTANTDNSHIRNGDSSRSHSFTNSNCSNNSNAWSCVGSNQGKKFESSQNDCQSTQSSSHFDVWLQENHRVGEEFLKDVEQIVDVAANLYASRETGD